MNNIFKVFGNHAKFSAICDALLNFKEVPKVGNVKIFDPNFITAI